MKFTPNTYYSTRYVYWLVSVISNINANIITHVTYTESLLLKSELKYISLLSKWIHLTFVSYKTIEVLPLPTETDFYFTIVDEI